MSKPECDGGHFADTVLAWFDQHGRHDLPWQHPATPYRVWVSEIMLQQTQVKTVMPYFERFMHQFPNVQALAKADLDTVLSQWAGLGYYARARNLHRCAQQLVDAYNGEFPLDRNALMQLPGIGRSTAGAILSLAYGQPAAILDGNVKRVLARYHGVSGWPGQTTVARQLWAHSEAHTPDQRAGDYNQAMMDLGAQVCTRQPHCERCPLQTGCSAFAQDAIDAYPGRKPKRVKPLRAVYLLIIQSPSGVLVTRRPATGIWGGLWTLPECPQDQQPSHWAERHLGLRITPEPAGAAFTHAFSHFTLAIQPMRAQIDTAQAMRDGEQRWYHPSRDQRLGMPAPVQRLLTQQELFK